MTTYMGIGFHWPFIGLLLVCASLMVCSSSVVGATESSGSIEPEPSSEIRRGMPMNTGGKSRTQMFFERLILQSQPDLKGVPDRLPQYMSMFQQSALNDGRMIAFDAQAAWDADRSAVVLTGHIEFKEQRDALNTYLNVLGFDVIDDQIELMPAASLGDKRFAVVTAETAILRRHPDPNSESLTQSRKGDPVFLLKPGEDGYFYCHGWDGYVGYIHSDEIKRLDAKAFAKVMPEPKTKQINAAIKSGSGWIGTPYKWGGTTAEGVDCSGLMRHSFGSIGVVLPRDADQQAQVGRLTATRWHRDGMRRGDLMFFLNSRGRINHTAVYLGNNKLLESGGPGVRILSLDPNDPDYNEKRDQRFCFAKRVIE